MHMHSSTLPRAHYSKDNDLEGYNPQRSLIDLQQDSDYNPEGMNWKNSISKFLITAPVKHNYLSTTPISSQFSMSKYESLFTHTPLSDNVDTTLIPNLHDNITYIYN